MGIEYVSLNTGKTNGAEGNSSSAPARFDAYTEVKNYYDKVKKDPSARVYSDTYKAAYGEYNKQKSQYYLKSCQDLLDEYNAQVQKFSGDQWKSGDEMIQSIQSAQKIKNKADILMGDISKNKDMFVQAYGQDVYDAVLGGFKDISKSTNNLLNYERDMTGVYKQFDSKEAYDRHVTLSKSPSADIQKQIDELNAQIDDARKKTGSDVSEAYNTYATEFNDFFPVKSDYDFDAAEKTLTELTSYLNNARKRELAEKYKIDVDSLSYSEMKKELESSARRNPEKYDYLKQYYDSMGESYWADRHAEEFVSGLSDEAKELYKQASEFLRMPHSTGDRHLPYVKRQIMEKTGIGEDELEDNLSLASRYFNAENRKDTQEKIVSMVNEHPVLNSVLLNLPTPVMNLIGGISAAADQTLQTISNQVSGNDTPIDTNTAGQAIYNISNDIRSATRDKIAEIKQPSLPKALGGQKLGVFAYDTLMSGVDSLVSMGAGGLAGLGAGATGKALNHTVSAITGVIMGSNAAAGTVQDSLAKGYGNWQSLGRGFASGLAESLTEHIGTEVLLDAVIKGGGAGKAILKSALSEGTEEVANNVLNGAVDWVFNGHEGRVTSLYKKYLSEGYTKKTAMSKAWEDVLGEDAGTFLSAAITGSVFGASGTAANSVYESETVKQIQNSIDNQIGGAGQANFLRGIQSLMKEADSSKTNEDAEAIRTHAVNAISDRITWILDNADSVSQNSVMLRKLGEEKVNADAAKMRKNAETLTAVRDSIKNGTYDSDFADYLIDINDSSVASDALESSSGQKRIKKAAETYMRAYNGNVSAAMDALFNTQNILNDSEKSLTAEKNNLSKSLASENTEAAKKSSDRIAEIDSELKKISLEKKNASELMAYAQKTFAMDVKNMLGKSAPNVKMDYTMKKDEEAKYNRSTGQISVNPYAILLAQSQMDTNARSNAARVKVVHEAGHAAAQADASFVPQVYAVYRELRENGLVTDVDVNEANITETYRNAGVLNAYLNTPSVQKQISSLVNSGMSESAARDAMVQAYMQEEYVMNFLEYVEKSGGKVYERLLPEQKNVFVRAMQKIAELFRRISAKIRGTDTSAAGKLENTAERILAAVREFAGDAVDVTASQEAETVQGVMNTGDAGNSSAAVSAAADGGERLSLASPVEETKDLLAVHNMTEENLRGALQLGGLPMPSIAIVKRDAGHSEYGPISVLFRRETIDPASDRRNRVYGGDAWTPVFPRVEYKANKNVEKRVRDKYYELSRKYGYESTLAMQSYEQDLSEKLTSAGGEAAMLENLYGDEDMMQIYLEDTGKGRVENVVREEKTVLTDEQARQYDILIDTLGREEMNRFAVKDGEAPFSVRKAFLERNEAGIREAFARTFKESGMDAKTADEVSLELDRRDLMKYVREAYKYMLNGRETVKHEIDYAATKDAIREKAGSGYRKWVRDLFGGAEEKSGIRNNKDMFTAYGNRRSFDALHYELTLENVVRAMREEEQKGGGTLFGGQSIWGAATKDYGSIGEIKADSGRLGTVSEDEYKDIRQKYTERFAEIANEIKDSGADNSFIAADDAAEILVDVLRKRKTVAAIDRELRKYSQLNIQSDTAQKAYDLFRDISNMPTGYFEAKPQRAVGFDEAVAVIVPQSTDSALTDELRSEGVRVETYTDGDEAARLDTLNRVADEERDVRFSLASPVKEQSDNIGTFDANNQDIRYSVSNESDTIDKLKARIQEDNEFLRHQTGRTEKTKWKKALTPAAVDRLTAQIRKTWGIAKSDENRLRPMFGIADECFNGKISYDEAFDRMRAMAKEILSDVYELDDSYMKQNEDFIRYIKSMTFSVPSENESDLSGGYAEYRRENAKYIKLSRSGTPIGSVYEEICGLFPGMLDPEAANPADQVQEIVEAMRSMEPETVLVYSDVIRDASESLVADVMSKYERGARETYSAYRDRMEKQNVESERKRTAREYGRELNTTVTAYEARIARIEADAARASDEYAKLLDQSRLREREASWNTTRRDMAARIRVHARALHSAAVSPTQKRFVPEAYRKNVDRIANWMRETANNTTGRTNSEYLSGGIREDIRALGGLFGEDFTDTANLLLDMADDAAAVNVEDTNSGSAVHVLRSVSQLGSMMRKMLADQNRAYLDGKRVNAMDTGAEIVEHLNKRKLAEKEFSNIDTDQKGRIKTDSGYGLRNIFRNRFMLNAMSGYDFLHRLGGAGDKLYETLRESQSEQVMHVKEYTDYLSEKLIYDKKNNADGVKLSDYIGDKQKMISVQLSGGRNISMTAAQAMSIVTLYEREAGRSHIEQGGVRLIHPESRKVSAPIALTEEDIRSIRGKLDKNDLRVMNVMNAFIRDKCTAWGNEATMEKYGFKRFTTADYFPIFVDKNSLPANMSADQARNAVQFNVENVGFAKSAKDNASAPLLVDSFIDVINRHVEGMATYAAYLTSEDTVNRIMSAPGVRDAMQRSLGSNSVQFMQEVMSELKGAGRYTSISDSIAEWWKRGSGVYKSAAVSFNVSTAAKQPLSYVRAAAVISPKYLKRGMHLSTRGGEAHSQMMKYSGIGVKKNMGYSDVGVARNLGAQIGYEKENLKKAIQDFNELGMYGAAKMDEITWDALWIACREEVLEKNPGISLDTEKWMNATAKRFSRVIAQTQVVDSPLDSSRVMRSSNPFVRNIMAFQNEPLKGFNLMMNSLDDLINAEKGSTAQKEAGKAFAKSVSVNVIGNVLEAVVSCAFRALRDDDDDFTGAVKANFGAEMLSNTLGLLPGVSQLYDLIYDALHGYDYNDMGISVLTDMVGSVYDLVRTAENPDRKQETVFKQVRDLAESVATFCGVPLRNIDRMLVNAAKAFFHVTNLYAAEYTMQKIFYNPSSALARERHEFASLLVDAYEAGDVRSYEYIYNDMEKRGVKPKSILSSLAKHMGEETTDKDSLVKFKSGSDGWYLAMQSIFNRRIDDPRATEEEITRVYDATNNTSLLPKFKDGTYSVTVYDENGKKNTENRSFTGEEYVSYLDEYGSLLYDIANAMRDLPEYRRGSDTEKAWWLTKAEVFAAAVSIYHRDGEYNYTNGGKWIAEYAGKRPVEVAKYIVKNLSKEN